MGKIGKQKRRPLRTPLMDFSRVIFELWERRGQGKSPGKERASSEMGKEEEEEFARENLGGASHIFNNPTLARQPRRARMGHPVWTDLIVEWGTRLGE